MPGVPSTQGSFKAMISNSTGRAIAVPDHKTALLVWRNAVGEAARYYMGTKPLLTGRETAVSLTITFTLPRPATVRLVHPTAKPDLDKLMRAVGDAVKGVIYGDDSQTCDLHLRKRYVGHPEASPEPGARIRVAVLLD